jgi:hypothetical protein
MCSCAPAAGPSGSQNTSCPQNRGSSFDLSNDSFCHEDVRLFPKAGPRKVSNRGKQGRKAAILTNTPEKLTLVKENKNKKANVQKRTAIKPRKRTRNKEPKGNYKFLEARQTKAATTYCV